jgi:hypothetical protein
MENAEDVFFCALSNCQPTFSRRCGTERGSAGNRDGAAADIMGLDEAPLEEGLSE